MSESAPVMACFRYCIVLLVHYSELEAFLLIRHLHTTHEVSSDRFHTQDTIIFLHQDCRRNVWSMAPVEHLGACNVFHSANRIDACVYGVSWEHEDKGGVCIKVHRFNLWWHKTTGLPLYLAPQARPLLPLLRVFCLYVPAYVA